MSVTGSPVFGALRRKLNNEKGLAPIIEARPPPRWCDLTDLREDRSPASPAQRTGLRAGPTQEAERDPVKTGSHEAIRGAE